MPNDNSNSTESKKTKVTITLDENLVNQIDSEVKKRNYSSRSNAIEVLLKSFIPKADTALFLLSGVDRVFKKDRELPLILEELRNLVKQGVRNITISYNESDVEFYKELRKEVNKIEMENKGVKITTDYTHSTNGDASTLIYFNYESSRFNALLVIHGTVLRGTDGNKVDYRKLYEYHLSHEADLTMVLGDLNLHDP
ncbi:MAG: ribbon-helix-helix protein, CopG family, partial [Promethearchaeota archaeon]